MSEKKEIGASENINGKRVIKVALNQEKIPSYQREILSLSGTGFFLPMRFVFLERICEAYYEVSRRIELKKYLEKKKEYGVHSFVEEGLYLIEHLFEQIRKGEEHLLFLEDYQLAFDLLFFNEKEKKLELLFLPKEENGDFFNEWKELLNEIDAAMNDKQWGVYSRKIIQLSMEENWGTEEILHYIRELKEQVFYSN